MAVLPGPAGRHGGGAVLSATFLSLEIKESKAC